MSEVVKLGRVVLSVVVEVVEEPLSLLLHEMTVRLIQKYGENDEYMFHLVSYWCIRATQYITSIGFFTRMWEILTWKAVCTVYHSSLKMVMEESVVCSA